MYLLKEKYLWALKMFQNRGDLTEVKIGTRVIPREACVKNFEDSELEVFRKALDKCRAPIEEVYDKLEDIIKVDRFDENLSLFQKTVDRVIERGVGKTITIYFDNIDDYIVIIFDNDGVFKMTHRGRKSIDNDYIRSYLSKRRYEKAHMIEGVGALVVLTQSAYRNINSGYVDHLMLSPLKRTAFEDSEDKEILFLHSVLAIDPVKVEELIKESKNKKGVKNENK